MMADSHEITVRNYKQPMRNRLIMMHQGHCVMDKAGKDKEDTSIDEILTMFNEISIECGN